MTFEKKLKSLQKEDLWKEYCGFLDLDINEYMSIQNRLMTEQIKRWSECGMGKRLLKGQKPETVEEFRKALPLTSFEDYADVLLSQDVAMLPEAPVIWIKTTWEGGKHPIKQAPYTRSMLDVFKNNVLAIMMLASSKKYGDFDVKPHTKALFGLAPLPYVTGLFPLLLAEEMHTNFMPPVDEALKMSFGERNKKGFEMAMRKGIDIFFGLSSVVGYMTENFSNKDKKGKGSLKIRSFSPNMLLRLAKASYKSKRDGVPMVPGDIFNLKSFVCAGTDTRSYKSMLEAAWHCRPMEVAAGTEPTIIGTETWDRDGLVFFPDADFYEFIPEQEMYKSLDNPLYQPKTYLMNELMTGQNYELVISSFKGGVFSRYRVGDIYRCLSTGTEKKQVKLPRLVFMDRIPTVIDIAGFTRITEASISEVIKLSRLPINRWIVKKEYNANQRPFMHMYVEIDNSQPENTAVSERILREQLSVYFSYFDTDYNDLKKMLGIEPLEITFLRTGTIAEYEKLNKIKVRRLNPSPYIISDIVKLQYERTEY